LDRPGSGAMADRTSPRFKTMLRGRPSCGGSTFPRTARTGAILCSSSNTSCLPTSPACRIRSTPANNSSRRVSKKPCVSETTPIFTARIPALHPFAAHSEWVLSARARDAPRQRARYRRYSALFRNDFLRQLPAAPAVCMADKAIGNAAIAAARAELHVESQQDMVSALLAEGSKVEARQFGEICRRELPVQMEAGCVLRAEWSGPDVRAARHQRPNKGGQCPQCDQKINHRPARGVRRRGGRGLIRAGCI